MSNNNNHFPTFQRLSTNLNVGPSFELRACRFGMRALLILSIFACAGFFAYQDRPFAAMNPLALQMAFMRGMPPNGGAGPHTAFEAFAAYIMMAFGSPSNCLVVGAICLLGLALTTDPVPAPPATARPDPATPHRDPIFPPMSPVSGAPPEPPFIHPPR